MIILLNLLITSLFEFQSLRALSAPFGVPHITPPGKEHLSCQSHRQRNLL